MLLLYVFIADILGLSLDEILREDCEMIKKISNDTKCRKKQSLKIRIMAIVLVVIIAAGGFILLKSSMHVEIRNSEQIISVVKNGDSIEIVTNIPKYRSITSTYMDKTENSNEAQISIGISFDFSMKNVETATVELEKEFQEIDKLSFVYRGRPFKVVELE